MDSVSKAFASRLDFFVKRICLIGRCGDVVFCFQREKNLQDPVRVTLDSVCMDPAKVKPSSAGPNPRASRRFSYSLALLTSTAGLDNYSSITKPLNWLTCKDTPWDWDNKCQSIFVLLKEAFMSAPILCHFDPTLPIILE